MGSLHYSATWYKIRHTGWQNNATAHKTNRFQPAKRDFSLFWISQCVTCHPTGQILYHVTVSCKGPICREFELLQVDFVTYIHTYIHTCVYLIMQVKLHKMAAKG